MIEADVIIHSTKIKDTFNAPPQNTLVGRDKYTITSLYKHVQGSIGAKTKDFI